MPRLPKIDGLRPYQVKRLANEMVRLNEKADSLIGTKPRFKVGDRVRILVQDNPTRIGKVIEPDPVIGSLGTIKEDHLHPVYGVRVDGEEHKPGLSGYHDDELELVYRKEGNG